MTSADLTLPTPGANPLVVLPPRRRTGARVEPSDFWRESGGTGKKITAAFPAGNSAKIWTPPHLKLRRPHPPRLTDPPSLLLRWALPVPVAGFEERMISSLYFTIKREPSTETE